MILLSSPIELRLSGEKLKRFGWEAKCSLEDMYRKMLRALSS